MVSAAPDITHEQLNMARLQLKKWQPEPWLLMDYVVDQNPTTPSNPTSTQS
jgi:hypothetical protein